MLVHFERTGGVAGLRSAAIIDTEKLPPDQAREIQELMEVAEFFDLPEAIGGPAQAADAFQYRLTVEAGNRRHTITVSETAAPSSMRPLLRRLTVLARSSQRAQP